MTSINLCLVLLILAYTSVMPTTGQTPCVPNPCKNGGTCTITKTKSYTCLCPKGTYGPTCTLCSRPCPAGQYESVPCSATRDRVCANCTVCSATQYLVSDCTPTTNRVCKDCILNPSTNLCYGYGYCYFHGDSHYVTFDGTTPYTFHYQGICKYLVSKPKVFSNALPYFEVYARGEYRWGWSTYAWARYAEIKYGGNTIRLSRSSTLSYGVIDVTVNGFSVSPGIFTGYSIAMYGPFMRLTTWFGLIVEYDGVSEVRVYVPPTYFNNQLTGICGNFDGIVTNDPTECNGNSYTGSDVNLFGDVCVVSDSDPDSCNCNYPNCLSTAAKALGLDLPSCITSPPQEYADRCQQLINTNGPFAQCIRKLQTLSDTTTNDLYDSCIMDACASNGEELCDSMRFLVKMCADLGIKIDYEALLTATKCSVK